MRIVIKTIFSILLAYSLVGQVASIEFYFSSKSFTLGNLFVLIVPAIAAILALIHLIFYFWNKGILLNRKWQSYTLAILYLYVITFHLIVSFLDFVNKNPSAIDVESIVYIHDIPNLFTFIFLVYYFSVAFKRKLEVKKVLD